MDERKGVSGANYAQDHAQVLSEGMLIYSKSNTGFCMSPAACPPVALASPSPGIPFTVQGEDQGQPSLTPTPTY